MLALVAGVHGALAIAGAGKDGAAGFLAEDVGIGQAELAHGALDQRGEALRQPSRRTRRPVSKQLLARAE